MEELLKMLVTGFPNLAVSVVMLIYLVRKIDELTKFIMDMNQRLMDECLNKCPDDTPQDDNRKNDP